ncbi:MAG: hypothetical protein OXI87_13360 [Albidovulum sp.]|nr:hypothetical protein [Albidovulum sp.]
MHAGTRANAERAPKESRGCRYSKPTCNRSNTPTGRERSAKDTARRVHSLLNTGHGEVVDRDPSNCFGETPHAEPMKRVALRASGGGKLGLGPVAGNEMLAMLDRLRGRQPWIERSFAILYLGTRSPVATTWPGPSKTGRVKDRRCGRTCKLFNPAAFSTMFLIHLAPRRKFKTFWNRGKSL